MAYQVWSVVFGEQPSASKWNILGTNDASFNDGTGIADDKILTRHILDSNVTGSKIASYRVKRKNNGSNTTETAAIIETGWFAEVPGVASGSIKTITFQNTYSSAPIVIPVYGGDQVSGAQALGNGGNSVKDEAVCKAYDVTTTGCKIRTVSRDASNFAAGNIYYVHYLVIGV